MSIFDIPDHPEVAWIQRTGYPSWMQEPEVLNDEDDERWDDDGEEYE